MTMPNRAVKMKLPLSVYILRIVRPPATLLLRRDYPITKQIHPGMFCQVATDRPGVVIAVKKLLRSDDLRLRLCSQSRFQRPSFVVVHRLGSTKHTSTGSEETEPFINRRLSSLDCRSALGINHGTFNELPRTATKNFHGGRDAGHPRPLSRYSLDNRAGRSGTRFA